MRIIFFALLIISFNSLAQVGGVFPDMATESLTNNMIDLPSQIKGKYALIGLAYSKKAEEDLQHWFSPVYNNFIHKSETPNPFKFEYDINTYFIPMLTGAKRPAYKNTMKKVQETVDPRLRPHVLFYEGTMNQYRNLLKLEESDLPYFFILDPDGVIIHTAQGRYTDKKMQEIINALAPSLKN
ncbi:hypothetical protein N6H18_00205 [Reichenbachiella agarivorans]|uniref:ATP10 protein n=1 Tax=Reichenbachiella agarivorans TaxID=2979464 RepID=A0ABY6CPD9_9BACT|nr:hypothetical protein [Reichenbachiella agarivorans]UXP32396.1 hypothetical protein N6H18_00205 [Reichenbachiella agarivorans]